MSAATPAVHPWIGILVIAVAITAWAVILRVIQQRKALRPEAVRKLFHLGAGAAALALPWLFDAVWPVLVLGAAGMLAFIAVRSVPAWRTDAGQVLLSVERRSEGEFWFLLGVAAAYLIAGDDIVVYSIGIVILAVGDAAAALVGVVYGRHPFEVPGGRKSAEGSIALFAVAFLCTHIPVLLFSDVGRLESLLVSLNLAMLIALAEADAGRGTDNFLLPVLVVVMLSLFLRMQAPELGLHTSVIVALGLFVMSFRTRTTLSTDALIGAALVGYLLWLLGGWRWLVAPIILFSTYTWLVGRPRLEGAQSFHADVLFAIVAPALLVVTLSALLPEHAALYVASVAIWGANLAVIGTVHTLLEPGVHPLWRAMLVNSSKSLVVSVPGLLLALDQPVAFLVTAVAAAPIAVGCFLLLRARWTFRADRPEAWQMVTLSVAAAAALCYGVAVPLS